VYLGAVVFARDGRLSQTAEFLKESSSEGRGGRVWGRGSLIAPEGGPNRACRGLGGVKFYATWRTRDNLGASGGGKGKRTK